MSRNCLWCGIPFEPKKEKQSFCCKKHYRKQVNLNRKKERKFCREHSFPSYHCWFCGQISHLDFHPERNYTRFMSYACPHCLKRKRDETFLPDHIVVIVETTIIQEDIL